MALSRCKEHAPKNKSKYPHYTEPQNHPNSGVICGRSECEHPGLIFLDNGADAKALVKNPNQEIFGFFNSVGKLKRRQGAPILPNIFEVKVKSK